MTDALHTPGSHYGIVDFHTHILPGADDGSRSCAESLRMIKALADSGVTAIALTPHFYPGRDNPEAFLQRRGNSLDCLRRELSQVKDVRLPHLIPGAEVEYFEGITVMSELRRLQIGESECLLLEMPCGVWSSHIVNDVLQLNSRGDCRIVLAHVERYLPCQKKSTVEALLHSGVIMQSNASFFADRRTYRKAIKMLKNGQIHVIGSDCHNMTSRPPNIGEALDVINRYVGRKAEEVLMQTATYLLRKDMSPENKSDYLQVQE